MIVLLSSHVHAPLVPPPLPHATVSTFGSGVTSVLAGWHSVSPGVQQHSPRCWGQRGPGHDQVRLSHFWGDGLCLSTVLGYVYMASFNLGWDLTRHAHKSNRTFTWQPGLNLNPGREAGLRFQPGLKKAENVCRQFNPDWKGSSCAF